MATKQLYSVHPSIPYIQGIISKMKDKTGRTLEEWVRFVKKEGPPGEEARRVWLKETQKLGTNYAWWIAERSVGKGEEDGDPDAYLRQAPRYVSEMYAGKRAGLKPLYDRLLTMGLGVGKDAKACPCKTMVPLYREHVFAEIKPATNSRIDLGLALGSSTRKIPKRVEPVKSAKGNRITHRIPITTLDEIDDLVQTWMKHAYDADA